MWCLAANSKNSIAIYCRHLGFVAVQPTERSIEEQNGKHGTARPDLPEMRMLGSISTCNPITIITRRPLCRVLISEGRGTWLQPVCTCRALDATYGEIFLVLTTQMDQIGMF